MSERPEGIDILDVLKRLQNDRLAGQIADYIRHLEAELEKLKADSKRLDKLLLEGCYIYIRLKGKIGPLYTREDIDKLEEEQP